MMSNDYCHFTLSVGIGHSESQINAFDRALISAGISDFNLIKISSIIPPNCSQGRMIDPGKGSLLPTAYTCIYSDSLGQKIAASVAVGIPEDRNNIGVIIKHCGYDSKEKVESLARSYAIQAMNDRRIKIGTIISAGIECNIETPECYCCFAAVSLW